MIPLIKLKKDLEFNKNLTKIVDALKGIALQRYAIFQRKFQLFEKSAKVAEDFISLIDLKGLQHPFVTPKTQRHSVLMVSSDEGFLGGLNSQVIQVGAQEAGKDGLMTVIGERGGSYVRLIRQDFKIFPGIQSRNTFEMAAEISQYLLGPILAGEAGKLSVVYAKPISLAVQKVVAEPLLPCTEWAKHDKPRKDPGKMIWESSPVNVLSYVLTQWVEHRLNQVFALSHLAELGARVMHLEGSYQEVIRAGKKLKLKYFRAKHELIDRSMREVFASQLIYGNKPSEDEDAEEEG